MGLIFSNIQAADYVCKVEALVSLVHKKGWNTYRGKIFSKPISKYTISPSSRYGYSHEVNISGDKGLTQYCNVSKVNKAFLYCGMRDLTLFTFNKKTLRFSGADIVNTDRPNIDYGKHDLSPGFLFSGSCKQL